MKKAQILLAILTLFSFTITRATTWDEPWAEAVIKQADYFVLAKVKSQDRKSVTIEIIKCLAGETLNGEIKLTDFCMVTLCSYSGGEGAEFHVNGVDTSYFFITKNKKGEYCLPTPTTGFDYIDGGEVIATYRHSYHKCSVPIPIYEKTMTAIFNNYHHKAYDKQFITDYITKYLSIKPAGFNKDEINTFFAQHIALESVYHLRLSGFYDQIIPFLKDTANFHNELSAARALISYNTKECKQELMKVIADTTKTGFIRVECIWSLTAFDPKELKNELMKSAEHATTEESGFGGNIMDPRVCTTIPTVKDALQTLIKKL